MPSISFLKFDADAWLTGKVQMLSPQEKGIFIDMVALAWKENGEIRNDGLLYRTLRTQKGTLSKTKATLLEAGLICEKDGFFVVNFVKKLIEERNSYILKQREFGKIGGKKKKGTLRLPLGYPKATLSEEMKDNLPSPATPSILESKEEQNSSDVPSSEFSLEPEIDSGNRGKQMEKISFDYEGDCQFHGIDDDTMERWRVAYPAIDIDSELLAAGSWLDANRKNRKYDIKRFLVGWFKRAQDRARVQRTNDKPERDYTGL